MAKQKFYCKGVERASGRRVAVTLAADNKESAVRIAKEHGVVVESVVPAPDPRPAAGGPSAAERIAEGLDEDVSGLLDSSDDEAEGLDLAGEAAARPTSPAAPATKSCPYCGERVLAVAIRCKHCGSYLAEEQPAVRRPVPDAAPRATMPPRAWVAIAAVAGIILIGGVLWKVFFNSPVAPAPAVPVATPAAPPPAPPKPETPKPSADEKAYAVKLAAFLDGFDKATQLLEKAPKPDEFRKQHEALKKLYEAVPPPPSGVPWTQDAAASSKRLLDLADMLNSSLTTLDEAMKALGQSAANSPESLEACRQAAAQMHGLSVTIRGLIPPACLTP